MALHQASGRWQIGLPLAITTAVFWATLPIAIRLVIERVDVWTLIWARFVAATLMLALWFTLRGGYGQFRNLPRSSFWLMPLAAVMLIGNFVGYTVGLDYTTPANAQLLIQAAPLLMAIGGIVVFGERFNALQWAGVAAVALGQNPDNGRVSFGTSSRSRKDSSRYSANSSSARGDRQSIGPIPTAWFSTSGYWFTKACIHRRLPLPSLRCGFRLMVSSP